jgi:hypothetical protein
MEKSVMCATLDHFGGVLPKISQVLAIKFHDWPLKKKKLRVAEQPPQKLEEVVQSPQKLKRRVVKMKMGWSNHPEICGSGSAAPFVLFIFKKNK